MKKLLWISFLLGLIFLWGCATTNKLSQDELFEKKQECVGHRDAIEKISKEKYWDVGYDFVEEIFYSPKLNSCLYTINETNTWWIYDFFSNKAVLELDSPLKCGCNETEKEFNQKKKELKGE